MRFADLVGIGRPGVPRPASWPYVVTPAILAAAMGCTQAAAAAWAEPLTSAMGWGRIDTNQRVAMFLAQLGHESGSLQFDHELWGPTPWQEKYEGSHTLGNTEPGDGFKFRGRGPIQITGRANYTACGRALNLPLSDHPELLIDRNNGARAAAWFWDSRGLNDAADTGDVEAVTKLVNGPGMLGLEDRRTRYTRALDILGGP